MHALMERQPGDAEQGSDRQYKARQNGKPSITELLGTAEEYRVWYQYIAHRELELRDAIYERYNYLIATMANRAIRRLPYRPLVEAGDVYNDASVGFLEAIQSFDPEQRVAFTTHAYPRVRGAIIDGLRHLQDVPRIVSQIRRETAGLKQLLWHELGYEPTIHTIVERFPDFRIGGQFGTKLLRLYKLYGELIDASVFNQIESKPESGGHARDCDECNSFLAFEQCATRWRSPLVKPEQLLQRQHVETKILKYLKPNPDEQTVIFQYFFVGLTDADIAKNIRPKRSTTWVSNVKENGLRKLRKAFRMDEEFANDIKELK